MNIIVAIIFGLKCAPECIKIHYFEGEHAKIFLGRGTAPTQTSPALGRDPTPFGASIRVPSARNPLQTTFLDTGLAEI